MATTTNDATQIVSGGKLYALTKTRYIGLYIVQGLAKCPACDCGPRVYVQLRKGGDFYCTCGGFHVGSLPDAPTAMPVPCQCGSHRAYWHDTPIEGRREYVCDECWPAIKAGLR